MSAPLLEGCESRRLHVGYSLEYADSEKGPSVPALSSMALPNLLDMIDHLQLGMSTPSDEDKPSEEQQDLLESLAVNGVPKSSKTKDVYQKFMSILDARPCIRDLAPTPKLRDLREDPPVPPGQVDPPPTSGQRNPPPNSGASSGSNWEPGRIPTDEEELKKLFSYRNPLYTKPSVPPPKVSDPILPIPHKESKAGKEEPVGDDPSRSEGAPAVHAGNTPVDHSQGDLSLGKMPKQEASSREVVKSTKGILCPSKLPRRDLKYSDKQHTILNPQGCAIGSIRLTDIAKSGKSSASGSGTAKHKEPDTPDLGSGGASAPVQKQVRIKGATYRHGSAPGIHIGTSLHNVLERDKDDDNREGEEEEDDDDNNDDAQGETPKDEDNEGEEDDEDVAQFVNTNPIAPKHWTQSQQAQQDKQESSLVKEILSDDEKQQKSHMEVQKASKELASPSDGQPSSQGEGSEPVPEEADLQDPGNKDESAVKEVAKLNTNRIPTAAQIHKRDFFKLGSPGNRVVDDIHSHWKSYLHEYRVLANAPYSQFHPREGWETVYTWESLEEHEPMLANTYGKKAAKPSFMVVVAPTTTEIGDDYFLNKLHKPACIKRKSVYYGTKVSGKRSHVQVVICPYCGVLSQNTPSGCSHIQRHLGLMFACGGCRKFCTEAPKKLQDHFGKCKGALAAKAVAELVASQNETSKEEKE